MIRVLKHAVDVTLASRAGIVIRDPVVPEDWSVSTEDARFMLEGMLNEVGNPYLPKPNPMHDTLE